MSIASRPESDTLVETGAELTPRASEDAPRPIRVVWEVQLSRRNLTGTGVYVARMIEHLADREGVDVQRVYGWRALDQCRLLPLRMARTLLDIAWVQTGLPLKVHDLKADVLHAPAYVAPLWGSCPLVVTVHDTLYRHFPEQYPRWWIGYLNKVMPRVLRRAAAVIAVSNHSKHDIVQAYGIDQGKVHVVPNGVDHHRFHPGAASGAELILDHYGVRGQYVLHVGALVTRKRIPVLLEAVALLKASGRWGSRQVVLAGTGSPGMPGEEEIAATTRRLSLENDVVLAGHVPDEWLPALYTRASVLAFPSLYEGFGLPLVEAMACGTPVVAAAGSSVTEVVADAGILVPPNDPEALAAGLGQVLDDEGIARGLRERGLRRAAEYSWDEAARRTIDVYRSVVDEARQRSRVSS